MSKPPRGGVDSGLTSYGDADFARFLRRSFLASAGLDQDDLGRPVVGIGHTISDYVTCHRQMPELVRAITRGVHQAGGLALSFPITALGEPLLWPTSMLYRNLAAMQAEELIRAQPMDAVVLVGGCDKTVPAQLMAAVSANVPTLLEVVGPMLTGLWRGERLGACTDCRRLWAEHRGGRLDDADVAEVGQELCPTAGTCMVMGTASTMACATEALGLMLPGGATPPAATGSRLRHATLTGRRAVAMAKDGPHPLDLVTDASIRNALAVVVAVGGSTNAVIHLLAVARRAGIGLTMEWVADAIGQVPLLVDCKPAGRGYMEDFDRAGGLPVLLKAVEPLLDLSARTGFGVTLASALENVEIPPWQDVIRTLKRPVLPAGSLAVLHGSLAPRGALLKAGAASSELTQHIGPAVVFDGPEDVARIDDPQLGITPDHVLVLRNAGPVAAGMPEAGSLPLPKRLAVAGVTDMVRVSDARMSGTAYGTVVLHCAPEAAVGGPLAFVRDGDRISLDLAKRRLDLIVDETELAARAAQWRPPVLHERGWRRLHQDHVLGADLGADLDFLVPASLR